jgi:hypothetical protein
MLHTDPAASLVTKYAKVLSLKLLLQFFSLRVVTSHDLSVLISTLSLSEWDFDSTHRNTMSNSNGWKPPNVKLIGGFNPSEKYARQIGSSSQLLGKIKMFQTTNQYQPVGV